jgi:hypothetical protein
MRQKVSKARIKYLKRSSRIISAVHPEKTLKQEKAIFDEIATAESNLTDRLCRVSVQRGYEGGQYVRIFLKDIHSSKTGWKQPCDNWET